METISSVPLGISLVVTVEVIRCNPNLQIFPCLPRSRETDVMQQDFFCCLNRLKFQFSSRKGLFSFACYYN